MKKAAVLLADGFEEIEALTAVDLLRRARIYVDTVSISDDYMVHGAHGINVQTEDLFEEVNFAEFDMIILPGGMPGTKNLEEHKGVLRVVKDFHDMCRTGNTGRNGHFERKESCLLSVSGRETFRGCYHESSGYSGWKYHHQPGYGNSD